MDLSQCAKVVTTGKHTGGRAAEHMLEARGFHVNAKSNVTKMVDLELDAGTTAAHRVLENRQNKVGAILAKQTVGT